MLGIDLHFARDAVTLSCMSCGEQQHVDRTQTPDVVAAATVGFCDTHVPCCRVDADSIPAPRRPAADQLPAGPSRRH